MLLSAGCLSLGPAATTPDAQALLSQVVFEKVLPEPLPFTAKDGVVLDVYVYRPDVGASDTKVPVIINYSPYWHNLAGPTSTGGDAFSLYLIDHFVPRGYAVALVSVRGTGLSGGCYSIGGIQEIDDADAIATFLAQQPWANGNVAAVGKSADGTVAQGMLARDNPHLKTIVPVSPISEWYKYNYYGGVPYDTSGATFNAYYVEAVSLQPTNGPENETFERTPERVCPESADVQRAGFESAATGDYTQYWQDRNYTAQLPATLDTSVFYIHGLQDWNVKPDHMAPWLDELYARDVTVKQWLGQWEHDYPGRDDWNATLLSWFDSELKGIDTGITREPLVQVQDDTGIWRDEDRWPPTRATALALYPSEGGQLGATAGSGTAMYGDVPGGLLMDAPVAGDVLYLSEPLADALRIVGSPVFRASVSSLGPRGTLAVALLIDGKIVDQGFLDLAHRNGLGSSEPLTPGETYEVTVPLYPQDLVVPAGSVLGLLVASGSPDGAPVSVTPVSAGAVVTITHGEGTFLTLPVVPFEDARIEERQPEDLGCWTC